MIEIRDGSPEIYQTVAVEIEMQLWTAPAY
jgi:hypothetical protein